MCVSSFLRHLKGQREKNKIPNLLHKRSPTESLFFSLFPFTPPRGTGRNLPTHRSIGPQPIFPCFLYATSWHRAEVPDILPNRSPTDFSFLHHLVVHFVSLSFFFTPPRGTQQKSPTHCSNGPRPTFVFFSLFFFSFPFLFLLSQFPFYFPSSTQHPSIPASQHPSTAFPFPFFFFLLKLTV